MSCEGLTHWKNSNAGRDWGQEEKGTTEGEMAGWHHRLDGHESEWTPGAGDGQGGVACCNSCGRTESDMTESRNWTELNWMPLLIPVITILMLLMIVPCIIVCLTHFVSSQVNKLQHAVPVQQGCIKLHSILEKYHSPLDGHHYKDSEAWD